MWSAVQFDVPSHINSAAAEEISKLNTSNVELHKRNDILSEQVSDEKPSSLNPSDCNDLPRLFKSERFAPDYIYLLSYSVYLLEVMICCQCQAKRHQVILRETKSRPNYFSPLSLSTLPTSFLSVYRSSFVWRRRLSLPVASIPVEAISEQTGTLWNEVPLELIDRVPLFFDWCCAVRNPVWFGLDQ